MLVHRGVHDNWLGNVVRLGQLHQLPGEFLPTAVEMVQIASAAHVNNAASVDPLCAVEYHKTGRNGLNLPTQHEGRCR